MCRTDLDKMTEEDYVRCLFAGNRGNDAAPPRFLTSLMMRYNGSNLMIDCGEGTQVAVKAKGWSFKPIDVICFTHYHADHISGLPGLLLDHGEMRSGPSRCFWRGRRGLERVASALRVIAPELPFPVNTGNFPERKRSFRWADTISPLSGLTTM